MKKYKDKQGIVFEVMTWGEFIKYGIDNGANIINGMPWSFKLDGFPVTHENDSCYLIPTPHLFKIEESISNFTPNDVLLKYMGSYTPIDKDYFQEEFTEI